MNPQFWIHHFESRRTLPAPEVRDLDDTPPDPSDPAIRALAASLAIFQLGESGGGSRLLAYARSFEAQCPAASGYERAVRLFVAEEQGHAELLRHMVRRLGGTLLERQWSNSVFRNVRNWIGLEFNIQVLLCAELIARGYYGLLSRHAPDAAIRAACLRVTRDEAGHIAFHVDFFRARLAARPAWAAALWRTQFRLLFHGARLVLWWDHGRALRHCGVTRRMFREKSGRARDAFLGSVARRETRSRRGPSPTASGLPGGDGAAEAS